MANRFSETRSVSFSIAVATTAFATAALIFLFFIYPQLSLWIISLLALFIFGLSYALSKYYIEKFIYQKIKLIYKNIHGLKSGRNGLLKEKTENLDNVNEAVLEWGALQRTEIEELKKMAAYRREFLGNVSHELKTPIFNIQGYVLTLLDGGLEDETINKDYLLRTERSINRLIAIVEDLEEISRLESGELKLNMQRFDLVELINDVIEFLEMKARKNKAMVSLDNPHERQLFVKADKKRIRQVLINLIENAIKYGDKEENKILIRFFDMDENYLIEVKDNGPGISEDTLPRLFERFYRTDRGRSRDTGGTGLGLAIVKHIIVAHNQTITVRSKLGQGATFSFTLAKN
jgi:two-component system, OmpR family, phosphate regulon sensor histidine kinase PhoR